MLSKFALLICDACFSSLPLFLQLLRGNVGLLFTNEDNSVVKDWFESYYEMDHARSGFVATQRVALDEGKNIILSYLFLSLSLFRSTGSVSTQHRTSPSFARPPY